MHFHFSRLRFASTHQTKKWWVHSRRQLEERKPCAGREKREKCRPTKRVLDATRQTNVHSGYSTCQEEQEEQEQEHCRECCDRPCRRWPPPDCSVAFHLRCLFLISRSDIACDDIARTALMHAGGDGVRTSPCQFCLGRLCESVALRLPARRGWLCCAPWPCAPRPQRRVALAAAAAPAIAQPNTICSGVCHGARRLEAGSWQRWAAGTFSSISLSSSPISSATGN